jgi:hypothetical protein
MIGGRSSARSSPSFPQRRSLSRARAEAAAAAAVLAGVQIGRWLYLALHQRMVCPCDCVWLALLGNTSLSLHRSLYCRYRHTITFNSHRQIRSTVSIKGVHASNLAEDQIRLLAPSRREQHQSRLPCEWISPVKQAHHRTTWAHFGRHCC